MLLLWIIVFCIGGGVLSALTASLYLLIPAGIQNRILPHMVSFAIGSLLGAAFLGIIPDALLMDQALDVHHLGASILMGILLFFMLEKLLLWRHCHSNHCVAHPMDHGQQNTTVLPSGPMILIGDGLHNFVDGILIAAAFLVDFHLGVLTAIAVVSHEIPQELGNFAVLIHSGYSKMKAFQYNVLVSITTVVGGVGAYFVLEDMRVLQPYILALAAANFLYIAVADLIPPLHDKTRVLDSLMQLSLILLGVGTIYFSHGYLHQ